jgi:drug/metabolite transporter (DMT)-like permease
MKANLALLAATLLWGLWGLADKKAVELAHPYTVQWMYALPYILALPLWYWLGARAGATTNHDTSALMWAVVASSASILATVLLFFALQSRPASFVGAATSAYPVVTMVLAVMSGSEDFNVGRLVGILFIMVGVVLVQVTGS